MRKSLCVLLVIASIGCNGKNPPVPINPSSVTAQQVVDAHNKIRVQRGLTPLRLSDKLTKASVEHSTDQARHAFMTHSGSDGSSPFDRMKRQGYNFSYAGENVAWNYPDINSVMDGWMKSPGHRANILRREFTEMGAAEVNKYWTVDFGTPGQSPITSGKELDPEFFPGGIIHNVPEEKRN